LVIVPEVDGTFRNIQDGQSFSVEGSQFCTPPTRVQASGPPSGHIGTSSSTASSYSPAFTSILHGTPSHAKRGSSFSLKIILARMTPVAAKYEFVDEDQTFVSITDTTANVPYITSTVKDAFNIQELLLVTANGLPVKDSSGTQGKYCNN